MHPLLRSNDGFDVESLPEAIRDQKIFWLDIDSTDEEQRSILSEVFDFHPLSLEAIDDPHSRIKIDDFKDYLFLTIRSVTVTPDSETEFYEFEAKNFHLYLSGSFVVTVHAGPSPCADIVSDIIDRNPHLLSEGPAKVAHIIMDATVDAYFPVLDELDDFVDDMEAVVFGKFRESALQEIFKVKKLVMALRRTLSPQRDVFSALATVSPEILQPDSQIYFRDIYDHVLHMIEHLDAIREILTSAMESYLSQVSNRLGNVTKGLSVIATLSIPFVIVSGMWGMNLTDIPFADTTDGFWIMLGVQILIGIVLLGILRWKKFL